MSDRRAPLQEKDLGDKLNVMLFSDHGMTPIQWMEHVIELDQHINMSDIVKMMDRGVVVSLWPKHNKQQEVRAPCVTSQSTESRAHWSGDVTLKSPLVR